MKNQKFSFKKRLKSFKHAYNGLKLLINEEHNSRIHLIAAICALTAGMVLDISTYEWFSILFAIGFVFAMELMNTCIENLADIISPEKNDKIKKIKDLSAAGALISSLTAFVVGALIFIPKIILLCSTF